MKSNSHLLISPLFLLLAGCGGFSSSAGYLKDKQSFLLAKGTPPAYIEGYTDGCSVGRKLAGDRRFAYRKDDVRFEKDALYARGWQEAQINCRNECLEEGLGLRKKINQKKEGPLTAVEWLQAERTRRVEAESKAAETEMKEIWEELKK